MNGVSVDPFIIKGGHMADKTQNRHGVSKGEKPSTDVTEKMNKGTSWYAEVKTTGQSFKVEVNSISGLFKRCANLAS